MIGRMLDVSTAHAPHSEPEWGDVFVAEHENGWVVFVNPGLEDEAWVPGWLLPLWMMAVRNDCALINFDQDGDVYEDVFQTWEW